MATKLGDAKIRIELDPREADETLNRLEERIRNLDRDIAAGRVNLSGGPVEGGSGEPQSPRRGGDQAGAGGGRPGMRTTGPGRFGVQNLRGMLSGPAMLDVAGRTGGALASAVPVFGAAGQMAGQMVGPGAELSLRYGAMAEGIAGGMLEGFKGSVPNEVLDAMKKALVSSLGTINGAVRGLDARLRAIEPTIESLLQIGKAQLLAGGKLDTGYLKGYLGDMYDIQRTMVRHQQDVRDKTLRDVSEAGGEQLIKGLMGMVK